MRLANGRELEFVEKSALQHESELSEMLNTIFAYGGQIKEVIEIGTFEGATAYLWTQLAAENGGKVIAVDVQFGTEYKAAPEWTNRCAPVYREKPEAERIIEVEGLSQDPYIINRVEKLLCGHKADLLFIDGDHNYEPALADYNNYSPFVQRGGWIAFHDILNPSWGVSELWKELKGKYPSWEFGIHAQPDGIQKTCRDMGFINGIGLLRWWGK